MNNEPATRMQLLTLRRRLGVADSALHLLRGKRRALMQSFYDAVPQALETRQRLDDLARSARRTLDEALTWLGPEPLTSAALASRHEVEAERTEFNVWGVRYAQVEVAPVVREAGQRGYDSVGESVLVDETALAFERLVETAVTAANQEVRLLRLGEEIRRLGRRMHALEDRLIPHLRGALHHVRGTLEEREREDVLRLKRMKRGSTGRCGAPLP